MKKKLAIGGVLVVLIAVGLVLGLRGHHHAKAPVKTTTTNPFVVNCSPAVDPDNDCASEPDND